MPQRFMITVLTFCIFCISPDSIFSFSQEQILLQQTIQDLIYLSKKIQRPQPGYSTQTLISRRTQLSEKILGLSKSQAYRNISPTIDRTSSYRLLVQKYSLSCEIAALRAILEILEKKPISEDDIIRSLPFFSGALSGDGIWGDPDKEFVGSIRGSQHRTTGYGVYEGPLSAYLSGRLMPHYTYGPIGSRESPDIRLQNILRHFHERGHVMFWGDWCTDRLQDDGIVDKADRYIIQELLIPARNTCKNTLQERQIIWKTESGKSIKALSGEHAFLLLGYIGSSEKPTHIIVWDTATGRHIYRVETWMQKWKAMDYRALVVLAR